MRNIVRSILSCLLKSILRCIVRSIVRNSVRSNMNWWVILCSNRVGWKADQGEISYNQCFGTVLSQEKYCRKYDDVRSDRMQPKGGM